MVTINDFPITVDQWNTGLKGEVIVLEGHDKIATLASDGETVLFNGKSTTDGHKILYGNEKGSTCALSLSSSISSLSTSSSSMSGRYGSES